MGGEFVDAELLADRERGGAHGVLDLEHEVRRPPGLADVDGTAGHAVSERVRQHLLQHPAGRGPVHRAERSGGTPDGVLDRDTGVADAADDLLEGGRVDGGVGPVDVAEDLAHLDQGAPGGARDGGADLAHACLVVEERHGVGLRDDHGEGVADDVVHVAGDVGADALGLGFVHGAGGDGLGPVRDRLGARGRGLGVDAADGLGVLGADGPGGEPARPDRDEREGRRREDDRDLLRGPVQQQCVPVTGLGEVQGGEDSGAEGEQTGEDDLDLRADDRDAADHDEERDVDE